MICPESCQHAKGCREEIRDLLNDQKVAADIYAALRRQGVPKEQARQVLVIAGEVVRTRLDKLLT